LRHYVEKREGWTNILATSTRLQFAYYSTDKLQTNEWLGLWIMKPSSEKEVLSRRIDNRQWECKFNNYQ